MIKYDNVLADLLQKKIVRHSVYRRSATNIKRKALNLYFKKFIKKARIQFVILYEKEAIKFFKKKVSNLKQRLYSVPYFSHSVQISL